MSVLETTIAFQWLYSTLSGDSTLTSLAPGGVSRGMAPPGTATPFVVFALQSGMDVITMNAVRLMVNVLVQVKAVGPASKDLAIAQAGAQIDALLKLASGTVIGGAILSCYRESPLEMDELVAGVLWQNVGGLYRILAEQVN